MNFVFKNKDGLGKENYQPVSVLSKASKAFERIVFNQMTLFSNLSFLHCKQDFVITTQKLPYYIWLKNGNTLLIKANLLVLYFLSITKLNALGFCFNAIKFVRSYFSERFLRVNKNNNFSKWCKTIVRMSFYSKFLLITFSILFKKVIFATLIHYIRLRIISKKLQLF